MWVLRDLNFFVYFWLIMFVLDGIIKLIYFVKLWVFVMDYVFWGSWFWGWFWKYNLLVICIEMFFDYVVGF